MIRISYRWAVVHVIIDIIAIRIGPGCVIAKIANTIAIRIGLTRIANRWAVVNVIRNTIAILIRYRRAIARITDTIAIRIGLIGITDRWAVIVSVEKAVSVRVGYRLTGGIVSRWYARVFITRIVFIIESITVRVNVTRLKIVGYAVAIVIASFSFLPIRQSIVIAID